MSLLSRIYTFAALTGLPIYGDNVDDELNQIINALAGISTNKRISIIYGSGTQPPLKLNQTGAGDIAKFQASGVDVLTVANNGQIVSSLITGTAPIVVASTTKVTNLNADTVNGIEGSALMRNDQAAQAVLGNLRIKKASTGTYDIQVEVDADTMTFYRYKASDNTRTEIFSISNLNSSDRLIQLAENFRMQIGYTPTADTDVVRKIDLINRNTVLAISGMMAEITSTQRACFFVAPEEAIIVEVKYGFETGTPTGDSTFTFDGQTGTLAQGATAGQVYTKTLSPVVTMAKNTAKLVTGVTNGAHANCFFQLVGYYTGN